MKSIKCIALAFGALIAPAIALAQGNGSSASVQTAVKVVSPYQNLYYGAAILVVVLVLVLVYHKFFRKK